MSKLGLTQILFLSHIDMGKIVRETYCTYIQFPHRIRDPIIKLIKNILEI